MRVAVIASACAPGHGSESAAGWALAASAAARHEVHLIVPTRVATSLAPHLARAPFELVVHPVEGRRVPVANRLTGVAGILLWYREVGKMLPGLVATHSIDVVHHASIATDWLPSPITATPSTPSVWGPVGGSTMAPWSALPGLGWKGAVQEAARNVGLPLVYRLSGRRTARAADVLVAQNDDTRRRLGDLAGRCTVEPNVGLFGLEQVVSAVPSEDTGARRVVYVGRLIPWKNVRSAVRALAVETGIRWDLEVIGDGPERGALEHLADELGVADRVRFAGAVPREQALQAMAGADALLLPSLHEAAGWVIAEATMLGVPVVCADRGGAADIASAGLVRTFRPGRNGPTDIVRALEQVLALPRPEPSRRWSVERFPDLLTEWYQDACDLHGRRRA